MMKAGEKSAVSAKFLNQLERRTPMREGVLICIDTPCFVARSIQVIDRLVAIARLLKVMRQRRQVRSQVVLVNFFDRRPDLAMQLDAGVRCQVLIKHFADERVRELLARKPRRSQNSYPNWLICLVYYLLRRAAGNALQQSRVDLVSYHRRDRQQRVRFVRKRSQLPSDRFPHSVRNFERSTVESRSCSLALRCKQPHDAIDEQGIANGRLIQIRDQLVIGFLHRAEFEELADLGLAEPCD